MKRKVVLFVVTQLLLFGAFYLTLNSYSNFNFMPQNVDDSAEDVVIEIVKGFPENKDSLELYPPGTARGWGGKKVTWSIREGANVKSFRISKKGSSMNVFRWFDGPPSLLYRKSGKGLLDNYDNDVEYEYWIHWKDENGDKHHFDPKIAIKPGEEKFFELIYIFYALLVAIISFITFKK
ncbi:MAG TPA: hypothetical protein VK589_27315 [Chryseolinea sp.]|nr:hypothetical protein [Chryseolinea sp.]